MSNPGFVNSSQVYPSRSTKHAADSKPTTPRLSRLSNVSHSRVYEVVSHSPSLIDFCLFSLAREVLNVTQTAVDPRPVRLAHSEEVRAQSAYGILGNVRQRLASSCSKNEGPNGFVNSGYVVISDK